MESAIYELKGIDLKKLKQDSPLDRWFYEMVQKRVFKVFEGLLF